MIQLAQQAAQAATTWPEVASQAIAFLGAALALLGPPLALWLRARAQRDAVIRGVEEAGDPATKRAIQARAAAEGVDLDAAIKAATKKLKGGGS